ncbi:MAG: BrnT family toxin [Proteobacteria bacterium]|nr:BrnT family toxin [Pseudomonadota bacterium]MBU4471232.1 BrnT family toxin [Pseudomonadota bacterium]MCG2753207.1 BrnT family toxin [Desulfobacteraceae bacterium]
MTFNYSYEWDPAKAHDNRNKHGVTFDEAATVFRDKKAISIFDPDHSENEDRWITLGISEKGRLLVVIHTFYKTRADFFKIRVISSRKATKKETRSYGGD